MSDPETKKCPFCAEPILVEAIKCKHCGSSIPQPGVPGATPATYVTTMPFLFESGPGFWKVKPIYWILLGIGIFLTVTPLSPVGFAVLGYVIVGNFISRSNWKKLELERTIREAAGK